MEELMKTMWTEEEWLLRELLLDDESSLFMLHQDLVTDASYSNNLSLNDTLVLNEAAGDVNSGPIIEGVSESSLSVTNDHIPHSLDIFQASGSMLDRGVCKGESKYTLQIKSCGNVMADDGYKWRKYGQKSIKNSSNPRSYFKCTIPRCSAKKQVQRSTDDPDTLIITYEGLHLHFLYPFFLLGQTEQLEPSTKKPKISSSQAQDYEQKQQIQEEEYTENVKSGPLQSPIVAQEEIGSQGLLEDIVPMVIRKPHINTSCSHSSSGSSCPTPPTSPFSFSYYSPLSFDIGV